MFNLFLFYFRSKVYGGKKHRTLVKQKVMGKKCFHKLKKKKNARAQTTPRDQMAQIAHKL